MNTKKKSYMIRTIVFALFVSAFVFGNASALPVLAADGSTTVYTTKTGKCYHTGSCNSLSKSKYSTTLENAVNNGYTPCSKCKPPKLDASNSSTTKSAITRSSASSDQMVWKSATGSCYHSKNNCGKMNPSKASQITESDAKALGLKKCTKCW